MTSSQEGSSTSSSGEVFPKTKAAVERMKKMPCCNQTFLIVVAVVIGLACGMGISQAEMEQDEWVKIVKFPGSLWLKALKMIVLPMIVFSMIQSMVMLRKMPGALQVGLLVVGLYVFTTLAAAAGGCFFASTILGTTVDPLETEPESADPDIAEITTVDNLLNIVGQLVPANLVDDSANNRLLPIIVAAIVVGLLVPAEDEEGRPSVTVRLVDELNKVVVAVISAIIFLTPIGVGSLVLGSAARFDIDDVGEGVGFLILTVCVALCFHALVVYPVLLLVGARRNPIKYFYNISPAALTALGTSSSAATLPVSIRVNVEGNGVSEAIAKFVLSLGATINMDGTGIYLICATFFLARLQDVDFDVADWIVLSIMATLCSMGAAPVPSSSLVLLTTIMTAVDVPLNETFGLITAVDWMLDRFRTTVNVIGDSCVTAVVNTRCGELGVLLGDDKASSEDEGKELSSAEGATRTSL
mmetsp:Transcript_10859/g.24920  ORF Transcript_10859/g.24920 Transcript_10859/m.24920 type:complete len:471 (-) Transcript_10859:289-1701(-)